VVVVVVVVDIADIADIADNVLEELGVVVVQEQEKLVIE
jgi:hypothetical protein